MMLKFGTALLWLLCVSLQEPVELIPDRTITRELSTGEQHEYRIKGSAGNWLISVEQLGIDVVLTLVDNSGQTKAALDSPLDEYGTEWLLVEASNGGGYRLRVRAREPVGVAGTYRLQLTYLDQETTGQRRLAAERAATAAATAYLKDTPESWREAAGYYEEAARIWAEVGIAEREARAWYCGGVLQRIMGARELAGTQVKRAQLIWQAAGNRRHEAYALNELGVLALATGDVDKARPLFTAAGDLRREIGDLVGEGIARNNFCNTLQTDPSAARSCLEQALAVFQRAGSPRREASAQISLGRLCHILADPAAARRHYDAALAILRAGWDRYSLGLLYNHLGAHHRRLGEPQQAMDNYRRALAIFVALEERGLEARARNNLGNLLVLLGEPERARIQLEHALQLRRERGDLRGEIATLFNLGQARELLGKPELGFELFSQAMDLASTSKRRRDQAQAFLLMAHNLHGRGLNQQALAKTTAAIDLLRTMSYSRELANALHKQGAIMVALGRYEPAITSLDEAHTLYLSAKNPFGQAQVHYVRACAARAQGRLDPARAHLQQAIDLLESIRASIAASDLRTSFSAPRHEVYQLLVSVTMAAHRQAPDAGHDREALVVAERWRARGFRELMATSGQAINKGIDAALKTGYDEARHKVSALADRRQKLLARNGQKELVEVELALERAHGTLSEMEAQLRKGAYAEIAMPHVATAADIQALAGKGTQLLVYSLGQERSYVWLLDAETIQAFELPGREAIDALARRVHRRMATVDARAGVGPYPEALSLSWMLVAPVLEKLQANRLVIIPDGALHYLPFAAMPLPVEGESVSGTLGDRFEILYLPSASALINQRRHQPQQRPVPKLLAIFADPIFDAGDPRVTLQTEPTRNDENLPGLARLPATRREAESIAALAQGQSVRMALGFEAARTNLTDLANYRFVHFATHGIIDATRPELSGLILSQRDERGRSLDGFLRLHDIYNLDLNAELVVLSGCETALGRELRGEGMVGLTRGFMYAGARGVVASLWPVPDSATAALMHHFYAAMLNDNLPPAAALRSAQGVIKQQPQWREPYFWAAFIYQGDWQGNLEGEKK